MHSQESASAGRSPSLLMRLEQACDEFEDGWRRGERPRIEEYLAPFSGAQRSAALAEFLAIEAAYRRSLQDPVADQDYLDRFPEDAAVVQEALRQATAHPAVLPDGHGEAANPTTVAGTSEPESAAEPRGLTSQAESSGPETAAYEAPADAAALTPVEPSYSTVDSADRGWQTKYDSIRGDRAGAQATPGGPSGSGPGLESTIANSVRRSGHYVLQSQIGRGGLGCVYLARDPTIGRKIAIKEMRPDTRGSAELVARFREEAQITGQLEHPNVVPIYELGDLDDGTPYYAMRLLGNQTLGDAIKRFHADGASLGDKRLALDGLLRAFVGVCQAMAYAHKRKVLHRDLKPINIMLGDFGEVFVLDWGLAKVLDAVIRPATASIGPESTRDRIRLSGRSDDYLSSAGSIMGTLAYMSPEQAQGRVDELDARSDVFALGAILYEILLGRPPYTGKHRKEILAKAQKAEFAAPRQVDRRIPRPLEAICVRAMALNPDDRYAGAAELAAEITRWQAGDPVHAYPEPWHRRCLRWARRHRTACGAALAASAAFLLTMGWWAWEKSVRVHELRTASVPLLLEAQRKLAEDDVDGARLTLTQVQERVGEEPALADVRVRLDELLADADQRLQRRAAVQADQERLDRFQRAREDALSYATLHTGLDLKANLDKATQTAEAGLALFDVTLDGFRLPALGDRHYTPAQQAAIKAGCEELLFVCAGALAQPLPADAETPETSKARATRALALLALPEAHAVGPHSCQLVSAKCYLRLGENQKHAGALDAAARMRLGGARDAFFAGLEALYDQDLSLARKRFDEAVQADPAHFWAQYFLAVCHLREEESDKMAARQAIAHLTGCLHRRPDFLWSYVLRGYAHGVTGDYAAAEVDFKHAQQLDSKEYGVYINRGITRYRQGNLKGAAEDLNYAIGIDQTRYQAYVTLAQVRLKENQIAAAKQLIEEAIEHAPGNPSAFILRAQIKRDENNLGGALADLDKAIQREGKTSPIAAPWHLERGRLLHRLGRSDRAKLDRTKLDQAKEAYDLALARDDLDEALALRGLTLMELGHNEEAMRDFDRFVERSRASAARQPILAVVHRERGLLRAVAGDKEGALEDYVQAFGLAPADPKQLSPYDRARLSYVRARRGYLLLDGQAIAERDFDAVLKLQPKAWDAYNGRALARVLQGRSDDARQDAEAALRLAKQDKTSNYSIECTNAACVYAQAARFLEKDQTRKDRMKEVAVCRKRGLDLLRQGIRGLLADDAADYARAILNEPLLDPIRGTPEFRELEAQVKAREK